MENDPICTVPVDEDGTPFYIKYDDQTYYFCSERCMKLFQHDPKKYVYQLNYPL